MPTVFNNRKEVIAFISATVGCSPQRAKAIMSYADTNTLRDDLAKAAATGSATATDLTSSDIAERAYKIADAMLKERETE